MMINIMSDYILNGSFKLSTAAFVISCMAYFTGACTSQPVATPNEVSPLVETTGMCDEKSLEVSDVLISEEPTTSTSSTTGDVSETDSSAIPKK